MTRLRGAFLRWRSSEQAIDHGLGGGPAQYLDVQMHVFPSGLSAATAFRSDTRADASAALLAQPGYRAWQEQFAGQGMDADQIRCGLLEVAGRTVGAAFVGCVAASLGVAEAIRMLLDGPQFEVISLSLRGPQHVDVAGNLYAGPPRNTGYTHAVARPIAGTNG
jgi:hypothetical protein